jgi:membrane protein
MNDPHVKSWFLEQLQSQAAFRRGPFGRLQRFLLHDVWVVDIESLSRLPRAAYRAIRVLVLTLRSFFADRCAFQASALTFTTVLSLVPLLAFSFSMLKGLGVYEEINQVWIQPNLDEYLGAGEPVAPGEEAARAPDTELEPGAAVATPADPGATALRDMADRVLSLVSVTDLKGLGMLGLLVLLLAVLRMLGNVEGAFNRIWGVHKARTFVRKVTDYLTLVVITPIFLVIGIGITTAAQNAGAAEFLREDLRLGPVIELVIRFMPLFTGWAAFTLVYLVIPNTRVRVSSALLGGLVAGTLWQLLLVMHVSFQIGVARYNAIYSSFAALPVFLVWVQASWVTVLLGAELAFAHQHEPTYRGLADIETADHATREVIALRLGLRVVQAFLAGEPAPRPTGVAAELGIGVDKVNEVVEALERGGVLAVVEQGEDDLETGILPATDPARIRLKSLLDALKGPAGDGEQPRVPARTAGDREVDRLVARLEGERADSACNRSLRDLALEVARREQAGSGPELVGDALTDPQTS